MRCLALRPLAWAAAALARLPQRLLLALSSLLAALLWLPLARRRAVAASNLALCFPELHAGARAQLLRANLRATLTCFDATRAARRLCRHLAPFRRIEGALYRLLRKL
jgi:lauroyl/myristoyl acyltransferase